MINLEGLTEEQIEKVRDYAESMRQVVVAGDVQCNVTSRNVYHFRSTNLEQFKKVIAAYPINLSDSACRIQIENPPIVSKYFGYTLRIMYYVGDGDDKKWIWLSIPLSEVIDVLVGNSIIERAIRSPYDTEHHYFVGVALSKIKKMQIPYYRFCHDNKIWYGGNCETSETSFIEEILIKLGVI